MKYLRKSIQITATACLIVLLISCGKSEKKNGNEISAEESPVMQEQVTGEKKAIEVDVSALADLKQGDVFEISVKEEEKTYTLQTRRVQETMPGLLSIAANIENRDTGLATLILRDGKLIGMLELYKENKMYKVGYDSALTSHFIQETIVEEMEGSAPLTPPSYEN